MDTQQAKQLLQKYHAGKCTEAEKALVEQSLFAFNEEEIDISKERMAQIKEEVYAKLPIHKPNKLKIYLWTGAAAALLVIILAIAHWKLEDSLQLLAKSETIEDVAPIANRATLTFQGGKSITLNGTKNGLVVSNGSVQYLDGTNLENEINTSVLQTLSTPRGGQYQLVLSDGTKVWLNAASSISYPSSFNGVKERRVAITGEVYFEVAPDKTKSFLVQSSGQVVRVLGTHFNVNDYRDGGKTITTLLEGSVRVAVEGGATKLLKPMQQLLAGKDGSRVDVADVELATAWKNGVLEFKDASIRDIMNEVSRWYDLEVEYRGDISGRVFNGSVSRKSNLSVLLKILSYSDINFKIELDGNQKRKLIVEP